jgi:hypothetical protein
LRLIGRVVAEFFKADEEITDAELGVDKAEVAVYHFRPVVGDIQHCFDLGIFAFDVELFEDFEPEQMGDGDAEGFFQAVGGVDDELLIDGLDKFGDGLPDLGGDEF